MNKSFSEVNKKNDRISFGDHVPEGFHNESKLTVHDLSWQNKIEPESIKDFFIEHKLTYCPENQI